MTDGAVPVDPFDLPDWLGVAEVTWAALAGVLDGYVVPGELAADVHAPVGCDLVAVDEAYPVPVASDDLRLRAHQAWRNGEVYLVTREDRLALAIPGTSFTADRVLEAIARLAKAVGASPDRYAVRLRIGGSASRPGR